MMADLPKARLEIHEPPFSSTGIDYFGPIIVKQRRSKVKRYGCIFTCMTSRAIHLELATDLSTSSFINALRRFVARRGPVQRIFSDNGTNFVGAEHELKRAIEKWNEVHIDGFLKQKGVEWIFNPPSASHMGGCWERSIRTVKKVLMAILTEKTIDDDILYTSLVEVENIVNSRPLVDAPLEPGSKVPLTPNHLLKIDPAIGLPPILTENGDWYSRNRYRLVQRVADEFWRRWVLEYAKTIIARKKWFKVKRNVQIGDVVLIMDSCTPRGQWPMGCVTTTYPDKHGLVRSVSIKTASGTLRRPIHKLCVLIKVDKSHPKKEEQH